MRICSLLPSATEVIALLGLSDELVGISHECDYPPSVRSVPIMVEPMIPPHGLASAEIDRQVRQLVRRDGTDMTEVLGQDQIGLRLPQQMVFQPIEPLS